MVSRTFYVNGDAGVAVILRSTNLGGPDPEVVSSYPYNNAYPYADDTFFNSSFPYLQLLGSVVPQGPGDPSFPQVNPEYITWDSGGCDCFSADTLISMSDGTRKKICEIQVGEKVLGVGNSVNTVTFIEKVPDSVWGYLYSPDPKLKPFITINHPVYIQDKLCGVDPKSIQDMYPWLGPIQPLLNVEIGQAQGNFVYNLWLTGDGKYWVNGHLTHSILNTGDFLALCYKHGWLSQNEITELLMYFTNKGKYVQYGAYLINKALVYVRPHLVLKTIAYSLQKPKGIARKLIVSIGGAIGKLLHPYKDK